MEKDKDAVKIHRALRNMLNALMAVGRGQDHGMALIVGALDCSQNQELKCLS